MLTHEKSEEAATIIGLYFVINQILVSRLKKMIPAEIKKIRG